MVSRPRRGLFAWRFHRGSRFGQYSACLLGLLAIGAAGCRNNNSAVAPARNEAVPVVAATAEKKTVPDDLRVIGTVEPMESVSVRARVGGHIMQVGFEEGQEVKEGDLLFIIDRRPLEAALNQAQAAVLRDEANSHEAQVDLARSVTLAESQAISQAELDQARAKAEALEATVNADRAAVESAKLLLDYCTIRAPIGGRTGDLLVDVGNLVKADADTPLVVINRIAPIYVSFAVPEQELPRIKRHFEERKKEHKTLSVLAGPSGVSDPVEGQLTFVDNAVDRATGTLELKATFPNEDKRLWPGLFVDVTLRLAELPDRVVVPNEAIQVGQEGEYVYIVKPDDTAELRPVTKGMQVGGQTVVDRGVKPGERVVTDGQLRLAPGMKVVLKPPVGAAKEPTP